MFVVEKKLFDFSLLRKILKDFQKQIRIANCLLFSFKKIYIIISRTIWLFSHITDKKKMLIQLIILFSSHSLRNMWYFFTLDRNLTRYKLKNTSTVINIPTRKNIFINSGNLKFFKKSFENDCSNRDFVIFTHNWVESFLMMLLIMI